MIKTRASLFFLFCCFSFLLNSQVEIVEQIGQNDNSKKKIQIDEKNLFKDIALKSDKLLLPFLNGQHPFSINEFSIYGKEPSPHDDIKTYRIVSTSDKTLSGRIVTGPIGIHITYLWKNKLIRIYPDNTKSERSYFQEIGVGTKEEDRHVCGVHGDIHDSGNETIISIDEETKKHFKAFGATRRVYRAAIVCTGEYFQANGNTGSAVRNLAIANLSDISAIFEKDMNVEMVMATGSPVVSYSDPSSDIFDPGGAGRTTQAGLAVEANFSNSNRYDVGHVFHNHSSGDGWDTGGVAGLGAVCQDFGSPIRKAQGWSGSFNNTNTSWIQLAAHEFGHMYDAPHTFNGTGGSCTDNISLGTSYEIGSGTTIMSYQGICASEQNISGSGDADSYFHANSLQRMTDYLSSDGGCNENAWEENVNTPPEVNANPCNATLVIPKRTAFYLKGEATDADGDPLTYVWEQYNVSQQSTQGLIGLSAGNNRFAPLFRSYPPSSNPERYFPSLPEQLDGIFNQDFEVLPRVPRGIRFRLVVRDNNPNGGAVEWQQINVTVANEGPVELTSPNGGFGSDPIMAGTTIPFTWETNGAEIICDEVDIKVSNDGGLSFPFTIKKNVNFASGSTDVTIPAGFSATENARFMIVCAQTECMAFYDISDSDIEIISDCESPSSALCDASSEEYNIGDPDLDLDLNVISGVVTSNIQQEQQLTAPQMSPAILNQNGDCIEYTPLVNPFDTVGFQVSRSGNYTFSYEDKDGATRLYSIYESNGFNQTDPCNSFVTTSGTLDGTLSTSGSQSLSGFFETCTRYVIAAHVTSTNFKDFNITNIAGPGQVFISNSNPDYESVFVCVNTFDNTVVAVNTDADFRTLDPGFYEVHSANYKAGGATPPAIVDPNTWIGQDYDDILSSDNCFQTSLNIKELSVVSNCFVNNVTASNITPCNSTTNTFDATISFTVDMGPNIGDVIVNGQTFAITGPSMTVTLTGIQATGEPLDLLFQFTEDQSCARLVEDVLIAPVNCCEIDIPFPATIDACSDDEAGVVLDAGTDGVSYTWLRDGSVLMGETGSTLDVEEAGIYTVIVDNGTCTKEQVSDVRLLTSPMVRINQMTLEGCVGNPEPIQAVYNVNNTKLIVWYKDDVQIAEDQNIIQATEGGEYIVEITANNGCVASDTIVGVFAESPIVDLGDDQILCPGEPYTLMASNNPLNEYEWTLDGNPLSETSGTYNITDDEGGEYIVIASNSLGCSTSDTVNINFSLIPPIDLGDDVTRCADDLVTLNTNAPGFTTEWLLDNSVITNATESTFVPRESGTYTANVSAGASCVISDEVVINYLPIPDFDLGEDRSACAGTNVTLDAGDPNGNTFVWSTTTSSGVLSEDSTYDVFFDAAFTVEVTNDSNGCVVRDTVRITFVPLPQNIELGPDVDACDGQVVTIGADTGGFPVTWLQDGNVIDGENSANLEVTENGEYTMLIEAGVGCNFEDNITVRFSESPTVELGDERSACPGDMVTLMGGATNEIHVWSSESGGILSETSNTLTVTTGGTYYVEVTNAGSCFTRDTVVVSFEPLPELDLGEDQELCSGLTFDILANNAGFDIEWFFNDDLQSGQVSSTFSASQSGEYIAKVSSSDDCSVSDTIRINFNDAPVVSISDENPCENQQLILVAGQPGEYDYQWYIGNMQLVQETTESLEVTTDGLYIIEATNQAGCVTRDSSNVSFIVAPTIRLDETLEICDGSTGTIETETNAQAITWFLNGMELMNVTDVNLDFTEAGEYVGVVGLGGMCEQRDTINVSLIAAPEFSINGEREICGNDPVEISVDLESGESVEWLQNGSNVTGTLPNTLEIDQSALYTAIVINSTGCETEDTLTVNFTTLPDLDLGDAQELCDGETYQINANTNGLDIEWFNGMDLINGETESSITVSESGIYRAIVSARPGCEVESEVVINFNEAPIISIEDKSPCENEQLILEAGEAGLYDYQWYNDNMILLVETSESLEVTEDGLYIIEASNAAGCISRDSSNVTFLSASNISMEESLEFCAGLSGVIETETNASAITWFQDDIELQGITDVNLTVDTGGEYIGFVGFGGLCEVSDTIQVNVIDAPEFTIEGLNVICDGETTTLTVDLENDESISWFQDGQIIVQQNDASLEIDEGGDYTAEVSNTTGCTIDDMVTVTLNTLPENTLIDVPDLCEGEDFTMIAETDGDSFEWQDLTGTISGANDLSLEILESGTYAFVSSNAGCETSTEFEVIFNEVPMADLGGDQSACLGFPVEFNVPDENGNDYEWTLDGNTISGETSSSLTIEDVDGIYGVNITNEFGCEASSVADVSFNQPPSLMVNEATASYCEGSSATIGITTSANIVRWLLDNNLQDENVNELTVNTAGTYVVEVESDDGCVISETITVTENALPSIAIEDQSLCPGETVDVSVASGFDSYEWTGVNSTTNSATIEFVSFGQITTEQFSLTVIDDASCSAITDFSVTYFPPISAQTIDNQISICLGESVELQTQGGLYYEWNDPNGSLSATDIASPIATPSTTTTYTVEVSDDCPNNIETLTIDVTVNPAPDANAGLDTCAILNVPLELQATGGEIYSWNNSDLIEGSSNVSNPLVVIENDTTFTVTVTDANGCSATDDIFVCVILNPGEVLEAVTLITPNGDGANDELIFRGLEAFPDNQLTIFNRWGGVIYKRKGYQTDDQRWAGLRDGINLPADTYYYILEFQGQKIKRSITILRD